MTKEDLKNKLKITEDTAIHCPTLELAKKVLDIFHKLGLTWCNKTSYTECTDWDRYKENTIYYPFEGRFASLKHFQQLNAKIISAKEFITLHTEKEEFDLENYEPKGELEGFPKEIIARMLDCQEEQGNERDISVFEESRASYFKGFKWYQTEEGYDFWNEVILNKDFNLFFEKYPKQDNQYNSQEFKVGDEVIDIIRGRRGKVIHILSGIKGKVIDINTLNKDNSIFVNFDDNETAGFTLDGRYYSFDKHPRLLHYRDDYNYDVIDFNNLPERQEPNRWRAEVGEKYYYLDAYFEVHSFIEEYSNTDTKLYKIGNYFQTKKEAQEVANKLKEYFNQLINK